MRSSAVLYIVRPPPPRSRSLLLNLDEALFKALEGERLRSGSGRSALIRQALRHFLCVEPDRETTFDGVSPKNSDATVPPGAERARRVSVYLRPLEFVMTNERARGWTSPAAWCRAVIRRELGTGAPVLSEEELAVLRASTRELRRIGVNLNQLMRRLNSGDRIQHDVATGATVAELRSAIDRHLRLQARVFGQGSDRGA